MLRHGESPSSICGMCKLEQPGVCLAMLIMDGATWRKTFTEAKICVPMRSNFPVTLFIFYLLMRRDF